MKTKIVLLRHGESLWNLENRFTGWTDVDLDKHGQREAHRAGKLLAKAGFEFNIAYTSVLKRAIETLWIVLQEMNMPWIPVEKSWRLNERHYGALQGLNKAKTAKKYGEEQVHLWRRSFDVRPPALSPEDPRHPRFDRRYAHLDPRLLPVSESLKNTLKRVLPYWHKNIVPRLKIGSEVLIAAHGNSLRALVKHLDHISDEEIVKLNIPTGIPLVYELSDKTQVLNHYYLEDGKATKFFTK